MAAEVRCPRPGCGRVVVVAPGGEAACPGCGHALPLPWAETRTAPPCGPGATAAGSAAPASTPHPPTWPTRHGRDSAGDSTGGPLPQVPGYEVLGLLGRGGMGAVYLARQAGLNRLVAVKVLLAHRDQPGSVARFRAEAEAVARLTHPNIVQVHEVGEHDGLPFLSLEYVPGGSLREELAGRPLPPAAAARLVATLARAIAYAHERGVLHRDLKPANVLLLANEECGARNAPGSFPIPKIADFGLAKLLHEDGGQTRTVEVMGTPSYMPPEQAAGRARELGRAADVYSLGAVLYELLTGRPPFVGATIYDTLWQVQTREPVPPRQLAPGVPRDLETVCLKCLRKEPARRYAGAAALADDLERFLDGRPIVARPVSRAERAVKWARRNPASALAVGLAGVLAAGVVAGALAYAGYQKQRARYEQAAAEAADERFRRRGQLDRLALEGRQAEADGRWADARERLAGALEMLDAEPALAADDSEEFRADLVRRLAHARAELQRERETAQSREQERQRRAAFERHRDDALAHQTLGGFEPSADPAAARAAAAAALGLFGLDGPADPARGAAPDLPPPLRDDCYELLLIWAEAAAGEGPAGLAQALRLLDRAAALGVDSRALHLRRARYLRQSGKADEARAEDARAAAVRPVLALDWFQLGLDAYLGGRFAEARKALEAALRLQPRNFWALQLWALCQLREGRYAEARAALTVCVVARPDFPWPRILRAFALVELREYDAAAADLAAVLAEPADPLARHAALVNRGVLAIRQERWADAIADLREASKLAPRAYQPHVNRARAHEGAGDLAAAVAAMDAAIELQPGLAVLYLGRARLRLRQGNLAAARRDLDEAIARGQGGPPGDRADAYAEKARLLLKEHDTDGALAACDAALRARPDHPPALLARAEALAALHRSAEAGPVLDRYLAVGGRPAAEVYQARGVIHFRLRQYPQALEAFTRALALDRSAAVLVQRGWAYAVLDAPRAALADFDEALRLAPNDAEALCGRADARARLGRTAEALADVEAALKRGPRSDRLAFHAAAVYAQAAGQLDPAAATDRAAARDAERCRGQAVLLLREALDRQPADRRAAFWREQVLPEPALAPLRRYHDFVRLAASFAREPGGK